MGTLNKHKFVIQAKGTPFPPCLTEFFSVIRHCPIEASLDLLSSHMIFEQTRSVNKQETYRLCADNSFLWRDNPARSYLSQKHLSSIKGCSVHVKGSPAQRRLV